MSIGFYYFIIKWGVFIKIELARLPNHLFLRIVCGLFGLVAMLMLILALIFTFSGSAPNLFGHNVYIARTDAFGAVSPGDAVVSSKVPGEDIAPGNLVVYRNSEGTAGIAEIQSVTLSDNAYTYTAKSERGVPLLIREGHVIGKAVQTSRAVGMLVTFATSPAGVMLIVFVPCIAMLLVEAVTSLSRRSEELSDETFSPVKKQDEIPTFIPAPNRFAENRPPIPIPESAVTGLPDTEKPPLPLFLQDAKTLSAETKSVSTSTMPLSRKRLEKVMKEMEDKKGTAGAIREAANRDTAAIRAVHIPDDDGSDDSAPKIIRTDVADLPPSAKIPSAYRTSALPPFSGNPPTEPRNPGHTAPIPPVQQRNPGHTAPIPPVQQRNPGHTAPIPPVQQRNPGHTAPIPPVQQRNPGHTAPIPKLPPRETNQPVREAAFPQNQPQNQQRRPIPGRLEPRNRSLSSSRNETVRQYVPPSQRRSPGMAGGQNYNALLRDEDDSIYNLDDILDSVKK
ncbi:hypothetical protein FACS189499_00170 [Clostridia bacterium]|nr:hypothetical protein FACS189499_00170 [Clostridia bacterium]